MISWRNRCVLVARLTAAAALAASAGACHRAAAAPVVEDVLSANLDPSVNPGDDFFAYANGGWLKRNPIPASESSWGIGNVVREELYGKLRTINEAAAHAAAPAGSDAQKVGDFWITAMDESKANDLGIRPLQGELDRIDGLETPADVARSAFELLPLDVGAFFDFRVDQDERNSGEMSVHVDQGGLGLPDRDFYFNADAGVSAIRREYVAHLARLLILLGRPAPAAQDAAARVMAFETSLAKVSRKLQDLRDPVKNYNHIDTAAFTARDTPLFDWRAGLEAQHLTPSWMVVGQPEFFVGLDALVRRTPVSVLRDYLRLRLVSAYAPYLSRPYDDEDFSFSHRVLSGQQEPRARWKRVLDAEGDAMGMVVGRMFVAEYFPEATKRRYADLVEAIRAAYRERIAHLDWMSDATKAEARHKLDTMTKKVGYPDKWKDYSALTIARTSYCDNMMNGARWRFQDEVAKFGKPVDRSEWDMTPQTYNAYYNPSNNEIVLPAAIFAVPGVRDADLDDAVVYGNAGASTIGHEMTHGFDDEGRQYDAAGNLRDWWTPDDAARFDERTAQLVRQFDAYEPLPGLHVNGRATLGENIADYGGVLLGLDAFKKTAEYRGGKAIGGLSPLQRFFLGYALGWRSQERDEQLRRQLLSNFHAPAKWRVIGPMANIPDFYEAFGVKPNQPMWRPDDQHVRIW